MASQSLYRKWRSQTFTDLVGQEAIVRTLKNALREGKLAHAYLFTGPRGTGKTSTARLLAKTINCLHPQDGEPCNICQQCREITAGNSFNVIEIDAASNRGIDSIRELRDRVMMPPSTGKYKVYILDEAHMLTTEAFNALLKTLEEPPSHAIFVMATTDVHKMLPTVLSRCQRFDFKRITTRQIVERLNYVAGQEQIKLEPGAAELIARAAAGGMRDALSLLDQAIAYSGPEIALSQVQAMLGIADPHAIQKFITHVAQLDSAGGLHLIHELAEAGADLRQVNSQVAEYWRALMLAKAGADIATILDRTEDEVREITQTTRLFTLEELTECARVFAQNELMQKGLGTPQLGLELALLACIELHRNAYSDVQSGVQTVQTGRVVAPFTPVPLDTTPTRPGRPAATAAPVQTQNPRPPEPSVSAPVAAQNVSSRPSGHRAEDVPDELPDWDELSSTDAEEVDEPLEAEELSPAPSAPKSAEAVREPIIVDSSLTHAAQADASTASVASEAVSDAPSLTVAQVKEKWELVKRRVRTKSAKDGAFVAALLNNYAVIAIEGTSALPIVVIKTDADFHFKSIQRDEERIKAIEWALKIELGQECRLRLLPPGSSIGQGVHIPPPAAPSALPEQADPRSTRSTRSRSSHTTMSASARPSAFVGPAERSISAPQPKQQPEQHRTEPQSRAIPPARQGDPLARTNVVRENTTSGDDTQAMNPAPAVVGDVAHLPAQETRPEVLRQKACGDPVVQEVVRIFKAEIKEVYPK